MTFKSMTCIDNRARGPSLRPPLSLSVFFFFSSFFSFSTRHARAIKGPRAVFCAGRRCLSREVLPVLIAVFSGDSPCADGNEKSFVFGIKIWHAIRDLKNKYKNSRLVTLSLFLSLCLSLSPSLCVFLHLVLVLLSLSLSPSLPPSLSLSLPPSLPPPLPFLLVALKGVR